MAMVAYTPQRFMYNMASAALRSLAYPEEFLGAHWTMTPPAPTGISDIVYLDDVRDKVVSKVWTITALDWQFYPPTTWNGFGMTYTDENGVSKTFDIRTS